MVCILMAWLHPRCSLDTLSATHRALLALCHLPFTETQQNSIEELIDRIDWETLVRLAFQGGIVGLVNEHLNRLCNPPRSTLRNLTLATLVSERENRRLLDEMVSICSATRMRGLTLIPLKGAALLLDLPYTSPGMRTFSDLDLVTTRAELDDVAALLAGLGYREEVSREQAFRYLHHLRFVKPDEHRTLLVELHWTPFYINFANRDCDDEAFQSLEDHIWNEQHFRLLRPELMLLTLILHLSNHRYRTQLKWLVDIAAYARLRGNEVDWTYFWTFAKRLDAERITTFVVRLANHLLDAEIPDSQKTISPSVWALSALNPLEALIASAPQPSIPMRLAIDLFQRDNVIANGLISLRKGRELVERNVLPTVQKIFRLE